MNHWIWLKFNSFLKIYFSKRQILTFREKAHLSAGGLRLLNHFTRRHYLFFIQNKQIGVSFLDLNSYQDFDSYLSKHNGKNSVAYEYRKCLKRGYEYRKFDPNSYLQDINEINQSTDVRGGKVMTDGYRQNITCVEVHSDYRYLGIFKENQLVAYAYVAYVGDFFVFDTLLGHKSYLNDGIMYALFLSFFRELFLENFDQIPFVTYDTMVDQSTGLSRFKTKLGFKPVHVHWRSHK